MAKPLSFSTSAVPAILRLLADKAPHTTLAQLLADPSIGTQARSLTLADLARALGSAATGGAVTAERGRPGPRPAAAPAASSPAASSPAPGRRASASDKYDNAVLVQILAAPGPIGAVAVREKVGGTPAQFRSAVERLIEAKKISKSGLAKGTRYRVA